MGANSEDAIPFNGHFCFNFAMKFTNSKSRDSSLTGHQLCSNNYVEKDGIQICDFYNVGDMISMLAAVICKYRLQRYVFLRDPMYFFFEVKDPMYWMGQYPVMNISRSIAMLCKVDTVVFMGLKY